MAAWIFGRPTKCTFNSMARAAACGSRQKSRTPSCSMPRPARVWGISGPCACGMGVLCSAWRPANSMGLASFSFSSNSAPSVVGAGDGLWSFPTMLLITTRDSKPWREKHADRFVLDFLPPYSPELNPIERVWKLTRRRCLHNRYFENLKDIISAVEMEFANWTTRNAQPFRIPNATLVHLQREILEVILQGKPLL